VTSADVFFYLFAAVTLVSASVVVFSRNLLYSAFSLIFTLSGVAALYALLGADFLAVTQVLVYVGGILVLILFGVMFTQRIYDLKAEATSFKRGRAALLGLVIAAGLIALIRSVDWPQEAGPLEPTSSRIGNLLLSEYLLPFEIISVLLLVVLIGAVVVGKKEVEEE
jgi:NADH-quinone oxidoreductase subunit J